MAKKYYKRRSIPYIVSAWILSSVTY